MLQLCVCRDNEQLGSFESTQELELLSGALSLIYRFSQG